MNFQPLHSKIAVLPDQKEQVSPGGIILPDSEQKKAQAGTVVAVGPGKILDNGSNKPMGVKVGDRVYFSKYGGSEMKLDGVDYVILDDEDIYGIFPMGVGTRTVHQVPIADGASADEIASTLSAYKAKHGLLPPESTVAGERA